MDYPNMIKDSTELYVYLSKKGLSRGTVEEISRLTAEPDWMRDFRLRSYDVFMSNHAQLGGDLSHMDFKIYTTMQSIRKQSKNWDDVPESCGEEHLKNWEFRGRTQILGRCGAQYESEVLPYLREDLEKQGCNLCRYRYSCQKVS